VSENWIAKIAFFNQICHIKSAEKLDFLHQIDAFTSPEVMMGAAHDMAGDLFSFGMVLCELVTGLPPSNIGVNSFFRLGKLSSFALNEDEIMKHILPDCPEGLEGLFLFNFIFI
jgi:hypothetical protein